MTEPVFEVRVRGEVHTGFTEAEVTLTMSALANEFQISYSDRWIDGGEPVPINDQDPVQILIDDEVVLDGYADKPEIHSGPMKRGLTVSGRSKAGDLVDCAVIHPSGTWKNQTAGQIVSSVCQPFGILVYSFNEGAAIPKVSLEDGELAEALIARVCRMRGLIPQSQGGDVILQRVGDLRAQTPLWRGANIISGGMSIDSSQRFSEYHFHGQTRGSDTVTGQSSTQLNHKVTDPGMTRYRPTKVVAGGAGDSRDLGVRAVLERNQRMGRSQRISLVGDSWYDGDQLWKPNTIVEVYDPDLRISADLVIVSARYKHSAEPDGNGRSVAFELTLPEAYSLEQELPPRRRGRVAPGPRWWGNAVTGDFRQLSPLARDVNVGGTDAEGNLFE